MPKLIVAGAAKERDIPVELSFESLGTRVRVSARRGDGQKWAIVDIKEDGSLHLHSMVGDDLGFDLDGSGKVKIASSY